MKGMQLSKLYYETFGKQMIQDKFTFYIDEIAVGLVGEGSQCLGFDDEYSTDHDFGLDFCLWISKDIYDKIGLELQREYEKLPQSFMGYDNGNKIATDRTGVFEIESFYNKYTNCGSRPKDNVDWMKIPERFLSMATNGEVFTDIKREFTSARENLLNFYPLDVLKKKLSARLATMAQSGQYNYPRCMKRHDAYAAYLACNEFVKNALSAIFLLNKRYMPFYKWAFKSAESLLKLSETVKKLKTLVLITDDYGNFSKKTEIIESICFDVSRELEKQGYCVSQSDFLESHAIQIMGTISDFRLRNLHIMADFD